MKYVDGWIESGLAKLAEVKQTAQNIADGYSNLLLDQLEELDPELKEAFSARYAICMQCPVRKGNTCSSRRNIKHVITGEIVSGCRCNLSAATKAPEKGCPAGKWGPVNVMS